MIKVWLPSWIKEEMLQEIDDKFPSETGGVLAGYWADFDDQIVITHMIGPGLRARHRRFSFSPDYKYHREKIGRVFDESGGKITYLGDWHSHPMGTVNLSFSDHITLLRIARRKKAYAPTPLMFIWAGDIQWTPAAWVRVNSSSLFIDKSVERAVIEVFDSHISGK